MKIKEVMKYIKAYKLEDGEIEVRLNDKKLEIVSFDSYNEVMIVGVQE